MALPQLVIVDNPAAAEPKNFGAFAQITQIFLPADMFSVQLWSVVFAIKIGGAMMPDKEKSGEIHTKELLELLGRWSEGVGADKYIYVTQGASRILVPEMVKPQLPFAFSDPELTDICRQVLARTIGLPKP